MRTLTRQLVDELAARAASEPRRRTHHLLHAGPDDPVQRFLVVALEGSHFRVHRHATRDELATVVRGAFDLLEFDAAGHVLACERFGDGGDAFTYEMPATAWHTLVVRSPVCAFFEVKQGPYEGAAAAMFADWSPPENTPGAQALQRWLETARVGERAPGS